MGDNGYSRYPYGIPYGSSAGDSAIAYPASNAADRPQQEAQDQRVVTRYHRQLPLRSNTSPGAYYGPPSSIPPYADPRSARYPEWPQAQAQQYQSWTAGYAPTTYAPANYGVAASAGYQSANGLPPQNPSYLSPFAAVSSIPPTYIERGRQSSEVSTSQSSEEQYPTRPRSHRPHYCNYSDCNKSFRRKADLQRHITCVHERNTARIWYCDARRCDRNRQGSGGGFTRRDHLIEHQRNFHHRDIPKRRRNRGVETEPPITDGEAVASSSQQAYYDIGYANPYAAASAAVPNDDPEVQEGSDPSYSGYSPE